MQLQLMPEPQRRVVKEEDLTAPLIIKGSLHSKHKTKSWMRPGVGLKTGNPFLVLITEFERPGRGRLYAAIEVPEPEANPYDQQTDGDREPIYFECVDASWLDALLQGDDLPEWYDAVSHAPLYAVELTEPELLSFPADSPPGSIAWYAINYEATATVTAGNGRLHQSLFDTGIPVHLSIERTPFPGNGAPVRSQSSYSWLSHESGSPAQLTKIELVNLLEPVDARGGVAVYDVGQGAFQAALSSKKRPSLYVDMGGGVHYNQRSFPKDFAGVCTSDKPTVVLSHWDWDHWSSGARFTNAQSLVWLAPPVPETPIQASFAANLRRNGTLHIWHAALPQSVRAGSVRIEKCSGKTSNDSGLAVTIRERAGSRRKALLPGDAAYRYIRSVVRKERFSALSLTHHGGKLHSSRHYPLGAVRAICVNSAGPRNTYGHPLFSTLEAHLVKGWTPPVPTGYSGQRPCHVLLPWRGPPEIFRGGCPSGVCSVAYRGALPVRVRKSFMSAAPKGVATTV
jgi:beta-lactamase superfamily II metal-dependent hydrolase